MRESLGHENGEYTIEGVKYLIADNVITEIIPEETEEEVESTDENINPEDLKKFMGEVLGLLAEQQAQIEALTSKVNGSEETSNDQFSKLAEGVEKMTSLLSLIPAKGNEKKPEDVAGTITTALNRIKLESAKRN